MRDATYHRCVSARSRFLDIGDSIKRAMPIFLFYSLIGVPILDSSVARADLDTAALFVAAEAGAHPSESSGLSKRRAYAEAGRGCIHENRELPLRDGEEAIYGIYVGAGGGEEGRGGGR